MKLLVSAPFLFQVSLKTPNSSSNFNKEKFSSSLQYLISWKNRNWKLMNLLRLHLSQSQQTPNLSCRQSLFTEHLTGRRGGFRLLENASCGFPNFCQSSESCLMDNITLALSTNPSPYYLYPFVSNPVWKDPGHRVNDQSPLPCYRENCAPIWGLDDPPEDQPTSLGHHQDPIKLVMVATTESMPKPETESLLELLLPSKIHLNN